MRALVFCLCCLPLFAFALNDGPWLGNYLELETELAYRGQFYRCLALNHYDLHKPASSHFLTGRAALTGENWQAEIEGTFARTHEQRPAFDHLSLIGRYRFLNDMVGDCVSLTPGITFTQAFKHSVHDITSFHHGKVECELHVAVGKERPCEDFWISRWWGVFGLGVADVGSPWLRGELNLEKNCWDLYQLRLFAKTLWGLGHRGLCPEDFDGYGPILHQSIDLGLEFKYRFEMGLTVGLGYAYRIFARNFPARVNRVCLSLEYPFGIAEVASLFPSSIFRSSSQCKPEQRKDCP